MNTFNRPGLPPLARTFLPLTTRGFFILETSMTTPDIVIAIPDIQREISQRSIWGSGFRDWTLETKRRSAIIWLRACSKRGWVMDRAVRRA